MGIANSSMPPPDHHTLQKMEFSKISMSELKRFWKYFRQMDKNLSGTIELADFYKHIEEKRSIICDAIFELSDCNTGGTLDFGEFFCSVVTFCLFEREEILRYCFYIFDREKNGYIEQDELKMMINILYGISPTESLKGNARVAAGLLDFNVDGKVDFKEFKEFHTEFPALFYPVFRVQVQLRIKFGGESFWLRKARKLQDKRNAERARNEYTKRKEQRRLRKLQQKKVRKKMGFCRYTCCPGERSTFEELFPIETDKSEEELAKEEVEAKKKAREQARLEAELAIKNPETNEWKIYLKRKQEKNATSSQTPGKKGAKPKRSIGTFSAVTTIEVKESSLNNAKKDRLRSGNREERRDARRVRKKMDK